MAVYKVLSYIMDWNFATYMLQFGHIVAASHDNICGEWIFDLIINGKTFPINIIWESLGYLS